MQMPGSENPAFDFKHVYSYEKPKIYWYLASPELKL